MTCLEKYLAEHPGDNIGDIIVHHCPCDCGYCSKEQRPKDCYIYDRFAEVGDYHACHSCWNREIPEPEETIKTEKGETNMPTTRKTKVELVEEIENLNKEIKNLNKELDEVKNVEQYEEGAIQLKAMHSAFMNAGFTDAQAFELVLTMIQTNTNINLSAGATRARKF